MNSKFIFILALLVATSFSFQKQKGKDYDRLMSNFAYIAQGDNRTLNTIQNFMSQVLENSANGQIKEKDSILCSGCKLFFSLLKDIDQPLLKIVESLLDDIAVKQCEQSYHYTPDVCRKYSQEMTPFIVESIQQHFFDPDYACPLIKLCPQVYEKVDIDALVLEIVKDKPVIPKNQFKNSTKTLKILQLTDVHLDLGYQEGFPVTCNYPICCRNNTQTSQKANETSNDVLSGYWGTLGNCDLPLRTFDQFVQFVKNNVSDIDLILWNGDNVGHDEENSELNRNFNITKLVTQRLKDNLNITVLGSYGNNDAAPDYIYDFTGKLDTTLQQETADIWKQWLDQNAYQSMLEHGYYATRIPHLPGLKVISLNTFACTDKNYVLLRDSTDPGKQLQWLNGELLESEQKGESVYIIGHIPNNFCSQNWGKVYKALMERFQPIIKAQLFGHTHSDYYTIQNSVLNANETIGIQFVSPSMTSNYNKNPSFRVYEVDVSTYEIQDFHQYRLNLQKYNNLGPSVQTLEWDLQYSFKENYNLTDLSFDSLRNLTQNLLSQNPIYDQLNMNYLTLYTPPTPYSKNLYCYSTQDIYEQLYACLNKDPYSGVQSQIFHAIEKNWRKKLTNQI